MQKLKVTRNNIKAMYNKVVNVGYCNMGYLLTGIEPRFYNSGIYGWNWDGYEIADDICVITGYRNTLGVNVDREELARYEEQARQILRSRDLRYAEMLQQIKSLREKFIVEVIK